MIFRTALPSGPKRVLAHTRAHYLMKVIEHRKVDDR
jgi:hypothetical protein